MNSAAEQNRLTVPQSSKKRWSRPLFDCTFWHGFTISTTLRRLIGAGLFSVLLFTLVLSHANAFFREDTAFGGLLYGLCIGACILISLITLLRFGVTGSRTAAGISTAVALLLPFAAMTMAECLNDVWIWNWSVQTLVLNYILYMMLYGTVFVFSGSYRLSMLIINPLIFLLALVNHYVTLFRGTPFVPMDLFGARTAANVAVTYDFSFDYQVVVSLLLFIFVQIAAYKLRTPAFSTLGKWIGRAFFATLTASIVCIYAFTDQYAKAGLHPDFWNQSRGYHSSGVVMNFCLNIKYVHLGDPTGYQADEIDDLIAGRLENDPDSLSVSTSPQAPAKQPNIICIMNESLSDLSVLGDVQTNIPYMPFLDSLSKNTVRGELTVPVVGSGTSNTEFEFLTGVPTCFFPAGSNAYMLYVHEPLPSLTSTLMDQGYTSHAFHPYYANGWNRVQVYNFFGFSHFTSLSSVIPNSVLSEYAKGGYQTEHLQQLVENLYPGENTLVRRYVSDQRDFQELIRLYERRDTSKPFYVFNVTMQNHGSYTEKASNFQELVHVTGVSGDSAAALQAAGLDVTTAYPKTNQYLSLIRYTDDAFSQLIHYFEQQEEPTIICMFGDHQPSIEPEYVESLLGADNLYQLDIKQEMKRYVTPFYIWANFDIPEKDGLHLSANYLSSYLLQLAGLKMPAYNRYVLKISETLPVISTVGYMDSAGNVYPYNAHSPYTSLLAEYRNIAYNYSSDSKGRQEQLFYLNR